MGFERRISRAGIAPVRGRPPYRERRPKSPPREKRMNIRAARRLLLLLLLLCAAAPLLAQNVTFTSVQSGPWDDPNTWDVGGGQFPSDGSFHHVVIASGHTVTVANSALAADLTFT